MQRINHLLLSMILLIGFIFTITIHLKAQVPRTLSFQGELTDPEGNALPDGTVVLDFILYESESGGTALWTETQTVNLKNSIFSTILGSVSPLSMAFDKPYWIGIKVNGNSELVPRIALTSSPYSLGGTASVTEPSPGQNFQIKDSAGNVTHTLNSNGDSWSAGIGIFETGIIVGDTTVVPDTGTISTLKTNELKFGINNAYAKLGLDTGGRIGGKTGVFGWAHGYYTGVDGTSINGTGVSGSSNNGFGVKGSSSNSTGVNGFSDLGDGIFGISINGWAGHFGTGNVYIENNLKIDNVPSTTETNYLIWSSDHFVKVNTTPPTGGTFDGVLHNTPLIIKGPGPNPTDAITLNTDGTSTQTGKATFLDGLKIITDIGVAEARANLALGADSISMTNSNNTRVWKVDKDGTTTQTGKATLRDGLDVPILNGGNVTLDATGTNAINVTNSNNTSVWKVNKDGTSTQTGLATFNTGLKILIPGGSDVSINATSSDAINVTNSNNTSVFKVNKDGSSTQTGLATFNTGLKILIPGGSDVSINATSTDAINVTNSSNTSVFKVNKDGTSTQAGKATLLDGIKLQGDVGDMSVGIYGDFNTPINVTDASNTSVFKVSKDGTSTQIGMAWFLGGWSVTLNNGNTAELSQVDGWHIKDATGDFLAHNDANGNAFFAGDLTVLGNVYKGGGTFKIDHPIDPLNKYLYHSFVESPDMMNIYNGNIYLDENGEATVKLPNWFGALNKDFRYQLTAVGIPGPNLYVSQKVMDNTFKIAGGKVGMEVSWQVTGIRHDAYANRHRINVEEDKPIDERGKYLHPEAYKPYVAKNK